ncbi:hypothetical protein ACIQM0_30345 [Streptomyces sp. NPDC091387]|uniref:hypothetical protein n=1 Tax=Streptomyces sp. NPDC091387 TaxID=3365998 RepID=UPI0037F8E005
MASGHLPSRPSRCVACLVLTAAATLGSLTGGEAAAGPRTAASTEPSAHPPGPPGAPSGSPAGPLPGVTPSATPTVPPSADPSTTYGPGATAGPSAAPAPPEPLPSAHAGPSSDASGSPSPSGGPPRPGDGQSPLAGLLTGEGRQRPGRQLTPQEIARADDAAESADEEESTATDPAAVPAVTPDASASPETGRLARQALDGPAVRQVQEMSLGVGISLVGLGLGFLALRMRRTD